MSAIEIATAFLKQWEKCSLVPYKDQGGVWTISWGLTHLGATTVTGLMPPLTQEQADRFFEEEVARVAGKVASLVTAPVNDNQMAALVSFAYNCGWGALKTSTLLRLVNQSRFLEASHEFAKWCHVKGVYSKGLANRRAAEAALFTSADLVSMVSSSPSSDDLNAQELERIKA